MKSKMAEKELVLLEPLVEHLLEKSEVQVISVFSFQEIALPNH